ncbi:MAG: TolC family outer membrane protein [Campylobacteraceae bacterium]|nr:TolC family outer membrane protein [Campylobacteraceae bacterium]
MLLPLCFISVSLNALTLQEGVDEVLSTHPIILERLNNYNATLQDLNIAESQYLPSLEYIGTFARDKTEKPTRASISLTSYEHSLQLTQNLFNGFGTIYEVDYQKARLLAAANHYIENANDIAYAFIEQYIKVLKTRELALIAKESVAFHESIFDKVKKLYDSGSTTRSEFEKIDTSLSLAQSNYVVAQNNLDDALFNLERVLGRFVPVTEIESVKFSGTLPNTMDEMKEFARMHNPSILVSNYNIKGAEAQRHLAYKNYYPKIDAYVRKNWANDIGGVEGKEQSTSAGITLTYNFYRGGADEAQVEKSMSQIMKEQELKRDVIRKLDEQGKLSWSAKTYLTQQLEYLKRYEKTSAKTLELYQQEYDLGRRTLLDLLIAQNDHVASRSQIVTAGNDLTFASYRILDAMGSMVQHVLGSKLGEYTKKVGLPALETIKINSESNEITVPKVEEVLVPKLETILPYKDCFKVITTTLKIRDNVETDKKLVSEMSFKSQLVGTYQYGDTICPSKVEGIWAKTDKGWVSTEYLKKIK